MSEKVAKGDEKDPKQSAASGTKGMEPSGGGREVMRDLFLAMNTMDVGYEGEVAEQGEFDGLEEED